MSTRPFTKPALTYAEQVDLLAQRGLAVGDRAAAEALLQRISYYRLSAYWLPFKLSGDRFAADATLAEAVKRYEFDRRLRLLAMDAIDRVEIAIRTAVVYHLAHAYGAYGHEDAAHFHPQFPHQEWLDKLHKEAERSEETFVKHYRQTYDRFPQLPLWVAAETMSLGSLSMLYRGLQHDDKRAVATQYGVHQQRVFGDWLHTLSYVRNLCAHHGRLWNRDLAIKPTMPDPRNVRHPTADEQCWLAPAIPDRHRVYGVLLILRHLLRQHGAGGHWSTSVQALLAELDTTPRWQRAMGLPADWRLHPFWKD